MLAASQQEETTVRPAPIVAAVVRGPGNEAEHDTTISFVPIQEIQCLAIREIRNLPPDKYTIVSLKGEMAFPVAILWMIPVGRVLM
jgi:hypothetical protein